MKQAKKMNNFNLLGNATCSHEYWSVCSYAYVYEVMINAIIINHDRVLPYG